MSGIRKIIVLGVGRVGRAIALDLANGGEFEVTAADISPAALEPLRGVPGITTAEVDLSDESVLSAAVADHDLVVGAVAGHMGYETLERVLRAGRNVVDISFFDEDPFTLDALAKEMGVTAIVDCGVAPGCSNLILGHMEATLDETERFACYVGGLPVERAWPFEYRAPFSPIDVIEEYTRPARFRRNGRPITLPALTELERLDFAGVGTLEAFNTDGLRTLLDTCGTPTMIEKTLRYPGHAEKMEMLRETGLFAKEPMEVADSSVRPLDVTARLLFKLWEFSEKEHDVTVMRVEVDGTSEGTRARHRFEMFDRYDVDSDTASMARTTGYTCSAAVRLVASGMYGEPGISPPEFLGRDRGCYDFMMARLRERGIEFEHTVAEI